MDTGSDRREAQPSGACPYLPHAGGTLNAEWTRVHHDRRDGAYYLATLEYGQSLWLEGKPAQAILQLNKAWSAEIDGSEPVLAEWPLPYRALRWMLTHAPAEGFLGNPVRHFQHLATRVRGERAELRSWRAWACFHISRLVLPECDFPPDVVQIEAEALSIPSVDEVLESLGCRGIPGEAALFEAALGVGEP